MPVNPPERRADSAAQSAQSPVPAPARDLRAQSVHRLQVGLFGLCAMLLMVGLANIIMDRAKLEDRGDPIEKVIAADAPPKQQNVEPLADIGVVPSVDPAPGTETGTPAPARGKAGR